VAFPVSELRKFLILAADRIYSDQGIFFCPLVIDRIVDELQHAVEVIAVVQFDVPTRQLTW
jgi:hypothetical protein